MEQTRALGASKRRNPEAERVPARPQGLPLPTRLRRPSAPRISRRLIPVASRSLAPKKGFVGLIARRDESIPKIYRIPSSVDALLGAEFVQTLSSLALTDSWYSFVPSMLGDNLAADAAAKAVIRAHALSKGTGTPTGLVRCDSTYLFAINALRNSLDTSDSALVAVGLLFLYEGVIKDQPTSYFSHAGGISAILLARSRASPVTPLTRAVLYGNSHGTFQQPLSAGTASPFDDPYWLAFDPATIQAMSESTLRLRKLANQSLIRVPRLVAQVRLLRQSGAYQGQLLAETIRLAEDILAIKDEAAENELLHHVALKKTKDVLDQAIFPFSFEFRSRYEKETLILFWAIRLMVIKLCLILLGMSDSSVENVALDPAMDVTALEGEQERLVMNILMCWQDGFDYANPLSFIWGALMGRSLFRGKPVEPLRSWVWTRYQDSLQGWPITYSMDAMDRESDEIAGGPLTGLIAQQDLKTEWGSILGCTTPASNIAPPAIREPEHLTDVPLLGCTTPGSKAAPSSAIRQPEHPILGCATPGTNRAPSSALRRLEHRTDVPPQRF